MDLRQLRSFVAVAETGNMSRAVERANLTQPNLSKHVKALEEQLGLTLFERTPRGVELTDAGRTLLPEAQRMVRQAEQFRVLARRLRGEAEVLRVGVPYPEFIRTREFAAALRHLRALGTPQELQFFFMLDTPALAGLRAGQLNVGFVTSNYAAYPGHEGLRHEHLFDDPIEILLSTDHPLQGYSVLPKADLAWTEFTCNDHAQVPEAFNLEAALCRQAGFAYTVTHWGGTYHDCMAPLLLGTHAVFSTRKLTADLTGGFDSFLSRPAEGITGAYAWHAVTPRDHPSPAALALVDGYKQGLALTLWPGLEPGA